MNGRRMAKLTRGRSAPHPYTDLRELQTPSDMLGHELFGTGRTHFQSG